MADESDAPSTPGKKRPARESFASHKKKKKDSVAEVDVNDVNGSSDAKETRDGTPDSSGQRYEVKKILDRRETKGKVEYRIQWMGFPKSQATWEPLDNLVDCDEKIAEFETNCGQRRKTTRIFPNFFSESLLIKTAASSSVSRKSHKKSAKKDASLNDSPGAESPEGSFVNILGRNEKKQKEKTPKKPSSPNSKGEEPKEEKKFKKISDLTKKSQKKPQKTAEFPSTFAETALLDSPLETVLSSSPKKPTAPGTNEVSKRSTSLEGPLGGPLGGRGVSSSLSPNEKKKKLSQTPKGFAVENPPTVVRKKKSVSVQFSSKKTVSTKDQGTSVEMDEIEAIDASSELSPEEKMDIRELKFLASKAVKIRGLLDEGKEAYVMVTFFGSPFSWDRPFSLTAVRRVLPLKLLEFHESLVKPASSQANV